MLRRHKEGGDEHLAKDKIRKRDFSTPNLNQSILTLTEQLRGNHLDQMTAYPIILWDWQKVEGSAKLTGCYFDVQSEEKKEKNLATILARPTAMSSVALLGMVWVIRRDWNLALL